MLLGLKAAPHSNNKGILRKSQYVSFRKYLLHLEKKFKQKSERKSAKQLMKLFPFFLGEIIVYHLSEEEFQNFNTVPDFCAA